MTTTLALPPLNITPPVHYVMRLADTCLIHAQRLAEWCGHGPVLEEDIALTNMALDLVGQSRALLTLAGQMAAVDGATPWTEDDLAFRRREPQYFNLTLVEQPMRRSSAHAPGADFADTVLRNFLLATWLQLHWRALAGSNRDELAAIAGKALKESRYHQQHNADWVLRLGDGTPESARRMAAAVNRAWPWVLEMFVDDATDTAALGLGLGPARSSLREAWTADVQTVLGSAGLQCPADGTYVSTGSQGRHSEHMGFILAEMQSLQQQFPGGTW